MDRKKYVIVMAAGRGTRMGADRPKQFLMLDGKPILQRTIEKFVGACPDVKVITVLPKEYIGYWKDYCSSHGVNLAQQLVEGGMTRFHSVRNALEKVPAGAVVAIHDGVRPLVSETLIRNMFERMKSCRALIPVLPTVDTLRALKSGKKADGTEVLEAMEGVKPDRSVIWAVQTPQMFLSEEIKDAYTQGYDLCFTDDASVAEKKRIPLSFIRGERFNVKITTPDDIEFAKAVGSLVP